MPEGVAYRLASNPADFVPYQRKEISRLAFHMHPKFGARLAETRAVNRALRKAYGIGICSIEEIATFNPGTEPAAAVRKPAQAAAESNGHPLRDRLRLLVREHRLDARLVKLYAADFCGTEELRQVSRGQMQKFIEHLASEATSDGAALRQKLESYQKPNEGAA